ncbi:MAG TPA: efflux RND transporter periplasmic adaptor subunit [Thermoanaerobaculia bacterium]|nr:efflux RND transporter periplasmic adaptor subunit [Thermoanaerobaculia bacterium]
MSESPLSTYQRPKKKSRRKLYIILGIVLLLAVAVGASVASKKREKPILVTTDQAFRKTITQVVTATGKIQPENEVKIAPEVSGEIIEIPVKEGEVVRRGQLLLRIKPDSYRAQVESQQAALSAARSDAVRNRAQVSKAESDYRRARKLFEDGLLSDAERNNAQTSYDVARAALEASQFEIQRSEGALKQIGEALSKTTIFSPAGGTISSLTSRVGERVVGTSQFAGTEVMRIADLDHMEARVNVNENDIVNVKAGDRVRIHVDAYPDRDIEGVVREIASTALTRNLGTQEEVTNFEVKIRIRDASLRLRPGMSATADIETDTVQNAIAVPIQSVTVRRTDSDLSPEELEKQKVQRESREKSDNRADVTNEQLDQKRERDLRAKLQRVVFIKTGDTVKMQKVDTGIADNTYIEIKSGVKPGDEVVSGSYTAISRRLKNGAKVALEKELEKKG